MEPTFANPSKEIRTHRPWLGLLLGVWALFLFVALIDFKPEQSWWHSTMTVTADQTQIPERPENLMGGLGVILAFWSLWFLGMASYLAPMYMGWVSYLMFSGQAQRVTRSRVWAIALCLISAAAWLNLFETHFVAQNSVNYDYFPGGLGGQIGVFFYHVFLLQFLGSFGSTIVMLLVFGGGTSMIFTDELQKLWSATRTHFGKLMSPAEQAQSSQMVYTTPINSSQESTPAKPRRKMVDRVKQMLSSKAKDKPVDADILAGVGQTQKDVAGKMEVEQLKVFNGPAVAKSTRGLPKRKNGFRMPTLDILTQPVLSNRQKMDEGHQQKAAALVRILSEFGVKVTPGEIHMGPVVTRYDVIPAQGVRVEKILNLEKNLQLGLRSQSVRILAPVPGKSCVGVELPNLHPEAVLLRDILESRDWASASGDIPVALGKESSGKPLIADLARMPHLLIAGATGSGKTVCLNSIIASLLYRFTPEDLRFVMVDPKIIELQVYNTLPHMLIPVVTNPKRVPAALKYLINEMERRYHIFAKTGVKNLAGFNAKRARDRAAMEAADQAEMSAEERAAIAEVEANAEGTKVDIPDHLPYIVAVIDELADLMMVAPADIENSIVRLAQLARAAGIHLIIATQRPSVNVITGLIKANLPSRIAFKVASQVDSRTILDIKGAEMLIGRGDMLFTPPGSFSMLRAQGAFVTEDEIAKIMEALKVNGEPNFDEEFMARLENAEEEEGESGEGSASRSGADVSKADLESALDILLSTQRASTSMLQRKLGWGYNRAARVMEELEDRGVVAPSEGSRPREILRSTLD